MVTGLLRLESILRVLAETRFCSRYMVKETDMPPLSGIFILTMFIKLLVILDKTHLSTVTWTYHSAHEQRK